MSELDQRFARLYDLNRDDLFAYIRRSIREEDTSLDLLQDAFLNFCRIYREKDLPGDTECRMYLFKIARNLMINHGKKVYTRRVDLVESYEDGSSVQYAKAGRSERTPEDQIVEAMDAREKEAILEELLEGLDEELRTILLLRHQSGLRLEDIAGIMDVSISTISRNLQKAERSLMQAGKERGLTE